MIAPPPVDNRRYDELLDEALRRIPVHNPEWTNFNRSDPGVTLLELFAFLTESLAYRADQIPERNRRAFLRLLGVPLAPAGSAVGIVAFANERGPRETLTLGAGLELRAGAVPFRTVAGLDVLPVEGKVFTKRPLTGAAAGDLVACYKQLYASYRTDETAPPDLRLYETVPLKTGEAVTLADTADGSLWIALLLRESDPPTPALRDEVRKAIAGRSLNLGIVPEITDPRVVLEPGASALAAGEAPLRFKLPRLTPDARLPVDASRGASYVTLEASSTGNVLVDPGVVQVELPPTWEALRLWENLDPLEAGVGEFPPALEETTLADRLLTWLRVVAPAGSEARILWAGINAAMVEQRASVAGEVLPDGTGEPDQVATLANVPVLPGSVTITVGSPTGTPDVFHEVDDLLLAGSEVPVPDLRLAPGVAPPPPREARLFVLEPTTGTVRFGDGMRGTRPPAGSSIRADYDVGVGARGNVAAGQIASAPALPAGITVANPVRTWGGVDAESVGEGEKQTARALQHRDRLVTIEDFETIARRTPGVEIGRIDVLPTWSPDLGTTGASPGTVTLLVVPRADPRNPAAPEPDELFLDAICAYLAPRRLVTTELVLSGPTYRDIGVSVGIDVAPGESTASVRDAVRRELIRFLAPVDPTQPPWYEAGPSGLDATWVHPRRGWPLAKPVLRLELLAVANRVPGVQLVREVVLTVGTSATPIETVELAGLELPRATVTVYAGDPLPEPLPLPREVVPVPVVPESC